jgi:hypothetical protein
MARRATSTRGASRPPRSRPGTRRTSCF